MSNKNSGQVANSRRALAMRKDSRAVAAPHHPQNAPNYENAEPPHERVRAQETSGADPPARPQYRPDEYLHGEQVAEFFGVSHSTIRKWRVEGRGPRYTKFGRRCLYRFSWLEEFIERNAVEADAA